MKKLVWLAAPAVIRYVWNRRKRSGADEVADAITDGDLSRPQDQTRAMEAATDVPGGVRP